MVCCKQISGGGGYHLHKESTMITRSCILLAAFLLDASGAGAKDDKDNVQGNGL